MNEYREPVKWQRVKEIDDLTLVACRLHQATMRGEAVIGCADCVVKVEEKWYEVPTKR